MPCGRVGRTPIWNSKAEQNNIKANAFDLYPVPDKAPVFEISLVPSRPLRSREEPAADPTVGERRPEGPPFLSLVDLFNDRPFARLNHIGSAVALDVAIVSQARGFIFQIRCAEPVVARPDHLIPKFRGNEKERPGLRQWAEFARMRRNS